jgi:hypothetical protein
MKRTINARLDLLFAAHRLGELVPVVEGLPPLPTHFFSGDRGKFRRECMENCREARPPGRLTAAVVGGVAAAVPPHCHLVGGFALGGFGAFPGSPAANHTGSRAAVLDEANERAGICGEANLQRTPACLRVSEEGSGYRARSAAERACASGANSNSTKHID